MEEVAAETCGQLLAIPHNRNLSNGLMFSETSLRTGDRIDTAYGEHRQRLEPIYEVT